MKFNSLAVRLFITSTTIALIVLALAAWQLIAQYRSTIETNFDERLKANLSLLIEQSLQENNDTPKKPGQFGGFAFTLPGSGWYWQIEPLEAPHLPIYKSISLADNTLKTEKRENLREEQDGTTIFYLQNATGERVRAMERLIQLGSAGSPKNYAYIVTGDSSEIEDDVADFAAMLALSFLLLGSGLILATYLQVKIGLQPLKVVERGLTDVRAGKTDKLEGEFPAEIAPLQTEINNLIKSNMTIIERARTHVGNLAHALKTPLSVINNECYGKDDALAQKITEQTSLMKSQITHHLDRARMAAHVGVVGTITDLAPTLKKLERALTRIYQDKAISFKMSCPETLKFAGEQQDFEEIVGNILDNAFKWANKEVVCTLEAAPENSPKNGQKKRIMMTIDDDGPGLSKEQQSEVQKRGKRLDETVPGTGLGLSIVSDLVELYGGHIELSKAPIGGLRVKIQLPAGT